MQPAETSHRQLIYEDPAFFRRLFNRHTSITPGIYWCKFKLPYYPADYALRSDDLSARHKGKVRNSVDASGVNTMVSPKGPLDAP